MYFQVWRDLKFKVKKKIIANKSECNATGGGRHKQWTLSPLEETVANMLQFEKQINPEGAVQGVACTVEEVQTVECAPEGESHTVPDEDLCFDDLCFDNEGPSTSQNAMRQKQAPKSSKRKRGTNDRQQLLEKHSSDQARILTDISNTLSSVKRSLKDSTSNQKRLLEIENKKLKLLEKKNKTDEELHETDMKIKSLKMLIKEKELQLLNKSQL